MVLCLIGAVLFFLGQRAQEKSPSPDLLASGTGPASCSSEATAKPAKPGAGNDVQGSSKEPPKSQTPKKAPEVMPPEGQEVQPRQAPTKPEKEIQHTATPDQTPEAKVLNRVNEFRALAGLDPISIDPESSNACTAHAQYLARNYDPTPEWTSHAGEENPTLPGYTAQGSKAGRIATIDFTDPATACGSRMGLLTGRLAILDPRLLKIGVGYAKTAKAIWVSVLDLSTGMGKARPWVIIYPVEGQQNVPLAFPGREIPDPLPDAECKIAGYPITVTFSPRSSVGEVKTKLVDESGQDIDLWLSSPKQPANKQFAIHQQNTICLIAKDPLKPKTTYSVHISAEVDGEQWTKDWAFTTLDDQEGMEEIERKVLERLNGYRQGTGLAPVLLDQAKLKACRAHARYLAANIKPRELRALNLMDEDPALPGYSNEGRQAAKTSNVSIDEEIMTAADWYVGSYLSRSFVLDSSLEKIGLGIAVDACNKWMIGIDYSRGGKPKKSVVLFPADGQQNVPLNAVRERPSPIPEEGKDKRAGYVISAGFPVGTPVKSVTAELLTQAAEKVPFWLSTPENPANKGYAQNTICLVPKDPLKPNSTYRVKLMAKVRDKPWQQTWSFGTTREAENDSAAALASLRERVNGFRKTAGLKPVELDDDLSAACQMHANYLARNLQHPSLKGLGMHQENPELPGYSVAGHKAGMASVIVDARNPPDAVDVWMSTLYHRIPIIHFDMRAIGFGCARLPDGAWKSVMDTKSSRTSNWMVTYPVNGQQNVPHEFSRNAELFKLFPEAKDGEGGYPVTLAFAPGTMVQKVAAVLKNAEGAEVPCWVLEPSTAGTKGWLQSVICLVPKERLAPQAVYHVQVEASINGKETKRMWSFSTAPAS
jgi:uncharacterized protein YkwD